MTDVTEERPETLPTTEHVKEQVQDIAAETKDQTRRQVRAQIDARSGQAGEQLASGAQAMRRASEQLRGEGKGRAADLVDGVADRGERLGAYLSRADGNRILGDVEEFARRQPWLVTGGSVVAGFLAGRFMKATSTSRYQSGSGESPPITRPVLEGSPAGIAQPRMTTGNGGRLE
jgi:hypothetical protein